MEQPLSAAPGLRADLGRFAGDSVFSEHNGFIVHTGYADA